MDPDTNINLLASPCFELMAIVVTIAEIGRTNRKVGASLTSRSRVHYIQLQCSRTSLSNDSGPFYKSLALISQVEELLNHPFDTPRHGLSVFQVLLFSVRCELTTSVSRTIDHSAGRQTNTARQSRTSGKHAFQMALLPRKVSINEHTTSRRTTQVRK